VLLPPLLVAIRALTQGDPRRWQAQIATGWDLKVFSPPLMGDGTNAQRGWLQ
jgi:hypothetical protein